MCPTGLYLFQALCLISHLYVLLISSVLLDMCLTASAVTFGSHLTTNMKRSWSDTQRRRITKRDVADTMLPCLIWMRKYNLLRDLPCDLISGFSVGFMVVPQGLSYAALVGVPPIYGLYAGTL